MQLRLPEETHRPWMRQGRKCDATGTSMRYTAYGSRVHTEFTSRRRSAVHKPCTTTRRRPDSAITPQSGELLFSSTLLVVLVPVAADIRLIVDIHETHEPPKADTPVDNRTCSNASGRCSRCFVLESTRLCSPSLQYESPRAAMSEQDQWSHQSQIQWQTSHPVPDWRGTCHSAGPAAEYTLRGSCASVNNQG